MVAASFCALKPGVDSLAPSSAFQTLARPARPSRRLQRLSRPQRRRFNSPRSPRHRRHRRRFRPRAQRPRRARPASRRRPRRQRGQRQRRFQNLHQPRPRECTPGGQGEHRRLILELKVIADVGLIGKPNAGKSTLLARLSRATPEIADYPFTTKYPNLGIVYITADHSFVLADLPGLIEGAHAGVGLGHEFLRHIERAGILVHLVEPTPVDGSDPLTNYRVIHSELELYSTELGARPKLSPSPSASSPAPKKSAPSSPQKLAATSSPSPPSPAKASTNSSGKSPAFSTNKNNAAPKPPPALPLPNLFTS